MPGSSQKSTRGDQAEDAHVRRGGAMEGSCSCPWDLGCARLASVPQETQAAVGRPERGSPKVQGRRSVRPRRDSQSWAEGPAGAGVGGPCPRTPVYHRDSDPVPSSPGQCSRPELWQEHWEDFAERPRHWVFLAQDPIFQLLPGTMRPLNPDSGSEEEAVSMSKRPLEAETWTNGSQELSQSRRCAFGGPGQPHRVGKTRLCG